MSTGQNYSGKGEDATQPQQNGSHFEHSVNSSFSNAQSKELHSKPLSECSLDQLLQSSFLTDFEKEGLMATRNSGTPETTVAAFARFLIDAARNASTGASAPSNQRANDRPGYKATGVSIQVKNDVTTLRLASNFGILMRSPWLVNTLRQDLRTWFMAYVPTWEDSYSPITLEESAEHYQMLDDFLSALISEQIKV